MAPKSFLQRAKARLEQQKPTRRRTRSTCYDSGMAINLRYNAGFYTPPTGTDVAWQASTDLFAAPFAGDTSDYRIEAFDEGSEHSIEEPIPDEPLAAQQSTYSRALSAPEYPQASRFVAAAAVNYGATPAGTQRQLNRIVIHITDGGATIVGPIEWFKNPNQRDRKGNPIHVSAHYVIGQDGEVVQMVKHNDIAWHAGRANGGSIGIEHVANTIGLRPSEAEYCASAALVSWLCDQFGISKDREHILGHSEADPSTSHRSCPNSVWDWDYYMRMVHDNACYPMASQQSHFIDRSFGSGTNEEVGPVYGTAELEADLELTTAASAWGVRALEEDEADAPVYGTAELEEEEEEADETVYRASASSYRKRARAFDEHVVPVMDAPVYGTGEWEIESETNAALPTKPRATEEISVATPLTEARGGNPTAQAANAFGWSMGTSDDPDTLAFETDLKAILSGNKPHPSTSPVNTPPVNEDDERDEADGPPPTPSDLRPHASSFSHDDFDRWGKSMAMATTYDLGRFSLGQQFDAFDRELDANDREAQRQQQTRVRAQSTKVRDDELAEDLKLIRSPTAKASIKYLGSDAPVQTEEAHDEFLSAASPAADAIEEAHQPSQAQDIGQRR